MVKMLLEDAADIEAEDACRGRMWTSLHLACSTPHVSDAVLTLLKHGADKNRPDEEDLMPLLLAIKHEKTTETGDISTDGSSTDTKSRIVVARALVTAGATVNATYLNSSSALMRPQRRRGLRGRRDRYATQGRSKRGCARSS